MQIIINPADVVDLKTPLYKKDKDDETVYRLLPETTADQVKTADGANVEAKITTLQTGLYSASTKADTALANSEAAQNGVNTANTNANYAVSVANGAAVVMQGASETANGAKGLVPMPAMGAATRYLRSDGSWATPPNTTYSAATQENAGLMSATDKDLIDAAKAQGQLGNSVNAGSADSHTLTSPGNYIADTVANTYANHWPEALSGATPVRVLAYNNSIYQIIETNVAAWSQRSIDYGNSWSGWTPAFFTRKANLNIYLSKNGDDANTGLSPDYPVLTIGRAMGIANAVNFNRSDAYVNFCFGAGNWGDISFTHLPRPFQILPYTGGSASEYSDELPQFGTLNLSGCWGAIGNIIVNNNLSITNNSVFSLNTGYKRVNYLYVAGNSLFFIARNKNISGDVYEIKQPSSGNAGITVDYGAYLQIRPETIFKLAGNITFSDFVTVGIDGKLLLPSNCVFNKNGFTATGRKLRAYTDASITTAVGVTVEDADSAGIPLSINNNWFGSGVYAPNGIFFNGIPHTI